MGNWHEQLVSVVVCSVLKKKRKATESQQEGVEGEARLFNPTGVVSKGRPKQARFKSSNEPKTRKKKVDSTVNKTQKNEKAENTVEKKCETLVRYANPKYAL